MFASDAKNEIQIYQEKEAYDLYVLLLEKARQANKSIKFCYHMN